jgi:hypothetical protein
MGLLVQWVRLETIVTAEVGRPLEIRLSPLVSGMGLHSTGVRFPLHVPTIDTLRSPFSRSKSWRRI